MPMFASAYGGTYTVSGAPVVVDDLATQLTHSIVVLLLAAVAVMAIALLVFFRNPLRLLPLVIALAAVGITFGLMALLGATLTMASIAVLPILIGLSVDYAVQFQSRVTEARQVDGGTGDVRVAVLRGGARRRADDRRRRAGHRDRLSRAAALARADGARLRACCSWSASGSSLLCALTAGSAAIVLAGAGRGPAVAAPRCVGPVRSSGDATGRRRARGTRGPPGARAARRATDPGAAAACCARPGGCSRSALCWRWSAGSPTPRPAVQSDVTKLVPDNMPALRDLRELERITGVSGEIDVVVHARNVANPQTIGWMISYEQRLFTHYGYTRDDRLCGLDAVPGAFAARPVLGRQPVAPSRPRPG